MISQVKLVGTTPQGDPIHQIQLESGGLTAKILSYGAILQDLRLAGHAAPLVLGSEDITAYFGSMTYFGAMVGRFANRIAGARFSLDGQDHVLIPNPGSPHALHGGKLGTAQKVWDILDTGPSHVRLGLALPHGDMGFPGTMQVECLIKLEADSPAICFDITARSDAPTPCSFAHHSYFNLDDTADICEHQLEIQAQHYLPVTPDLIPTGEQRQVAGTRFDFRKPTAIGTEALDHNFCLSDQPYGALRPVAQLYAPESGLKLSLATTAPGLQVYNAAHLPPEGLVGLEGRRYCPHAGLALETQAWPDAPNQPSFPSAILRPGDTYRHAARYGFAWA